MKHNKTGYKPSVFTLDEHAGLEEKLNDPNNGLRGYVELKEWIRTEFGKDILCRTVVRLCHKLSFKCEDSKEKPHQ